MVKTEKTYFFKIVFLALIVAFTVVILGAYTRLQGAGLGCPDWPGCYGQLTVPKTESAIASAGELYPNQPVEATKAWAEMTHRYVAGTLVLLIVYYWRLLAVYTMILYHTSDRRPLHRVLDVGTTCGREVAPSGKPQEYYACCAAQNTQSLYGG